MAKRTRWGSGKSLCQGHTSPSPRWPRWGEGRCGRRPQRGEGGITLPKRFATPARWEVCRVCLLISASLNCNPRHSREGGNPCVRECFVFAGCESRSRPGPGLVAEGYCVAARRRGELPNANDQSVGYEPVSAGCRGEPADSRRSPQTICPARERLREKATVSPGAKVGPRRRGRHQVFGDGMVGRHGTVTGETRSIGMSLRRSVVPVAYGHIERESERP